MTYHIGEADNKAESNPEKVRELAEVLTSFLKEVDTQLPAHKSSGEQVSYPLN